jgi:O-acetyl-ADP-ribose deacetylase (regulator of RNase III)
VTQWGGMEVGNGMMFAANVVDGLVHQLGGRALANDCRKTLFEHKVSRCNEGNAMMTKPGSDELREQYRHYIVHTVPPFYTTTTKNIDNDDGDDDILHHQQQQQQQQLAVLESCYETSLQLIRNKSNKLDNNNTAMSSTIRVACPLLGAGCRGFPEDQAIQVAANAAASLLVMTKVEEDASTTAQPITLAFAIPNGELRKALIEKIDETVNKNNMGAVVESTRP